MLALTERLSYKAFMLEVEFSNEPIPLGYFITFRCYGSWLHGRAGSVDRFHNAYGTKRLARDRARLQYNQRLLKRPQVKLGADRRAATLLAVKETCTTANGICGRQIFVQTMFTLS